MAQAIKKAKLKGESPWPRLLDEWMTVTGETLGDFADYVGDEIGDKNRRVYANVWGWHKGRCRPTGIRRKAAIKILKATLDGPREVLPDMPGHHL